MFLPWSTGETFDAMNLRSPHFDAGRTGKRIQYLARLSRVSVRLLDEMDMPSVEASR
jgi:hypothetical protein